MVQMASVEVLLAAWFAGGRRNQQIGTVVSRFTRHFPGSGCWGLGKTC